MFRATPGRIPSPGTQQLAGVELPAGSPVTSAEGDGDTVAWISDAVLPAGRVDELIRALAGVFDQTGLWPVRASGLDDGDLGRPWGDGELEGPDGEIPDALAVLLRNSADSEAEYPEMDDAGAGAVPALTALGPAVTGPDTEAGSLEAGGDGGLLLVPVARPADVPAALGWLGPINHDYSGADVAAVLRSWEERFGAVLVGIGFDTLLVQVGRRPETDDQVDGLLREHYAFCPDNIDQGISPDEYRAGLTEWTHWSFWWD